MTQKLLVLGGGFGLYGYLPAAINSGWEVSTLEKYLPAIKSRPELLSIESNINFLNESEVNFSNFGGLVIARTPEIQSAFIAEHLDSRVHMFLEKPLAANLEQYQATLNLIEKSGIKFSIAYLFRYQSWYREIRKLIGRKANFRIVWTIQAVDSNSWKNNEIKGGGLFKYYGVHILSLLLDLNTNLQAVVATTSESSLEFLSEEKLSFCILIKFGATGKFEVEVEDGGNTYNWTGESPFGKKPAPGVPDPRIASLSKYLTDPQVRADSFANLRHEWDILEGSKILLKSGCNKASEHL